MKYIASKKNSPKKDVTDSEKRSKPTTDNQYSTAIAAGANATTLFSGTVGLALISPKNTFGQPYQGTTELPAQPFRKLEPDTDAFRSFHRSTMLMVHQRDATIYFPTVFYQAVESLYQAAVNLENIRIIQSCFRDISYHHHRVMIEAPPVKPQQPKKKPPLGKRFNKFYVEENAKAIVFRVEGVEYKYSDRRIHKDRFDVLFWDDQYFGKIHTGLKNGECYRTVPVEHEGKFFIDHFYKKKRVNKRIGDFAKKNWDKSTNLMYKVAEIYKHPEEFKQCVIYHNALTNTTGAYLHAYLDLREKSPNFDMASVCTFIKSSEMQPVTEDFELSPPNKLQEAWEEAELEKLRRIFTGEGIGPNGKKREKWSGGSAAWRKYEEQLQTEKIRAKVSAMENQLRILKIKQNQLKNDVRERKIDAEYAEKKQADLARKTRYVQVLINQIN